MLMDLRVLQESTKIAFDSDGVIMYRRSGGGGISAWPGRISQASRRLSAVTANNLNALGEEAIEVVRDIVRTTPKPE